MLFLYVLSTLSHKAHFDRTRLFHINNKSVGSGKMLDKLSDICFDLSIFADENENKTQISS